MILLIDNYDSFTYNIYQALAERGAVRVFPNDKIRVREIGELKPEGIVISPGPGRPEAATLSMELIGKFAGDFPILGVCLGCQALALAFGGRIREAPSIMHGKVSDIHHDGRGVFQGLPSPFSAMRYHSLAVAPDRVPDELEVSARTGEGVIMGLRHRRHASLEGVQFHPESILTPEGPRLLANFSESCRRGRDSLPPGLPAR